MAKKAAVLVVDPVNGAGLFHYLEAFFENGIPFRTFAVAETPQVTTNSGVALRLAVKHPEGDIDPLDLLHMILLGKAFG